MSLDFLPNWSFATGTVIGAILWIAWFAIAIAALGIIPANRRPSTGMAWLLLILIAPFIGFAIFLLLGSPRIERKRHEKQAEVNDIITSRTHGEVSRYGEVDRTRLPTVGRRAQPQARGAADAGQQRRRAAHGLLRDPRPR